MREVGAPVPPAAPLRVSAQRGSVEGESSRMVTDSCSTAESSCEVSEPGNRSSRSSCRDVDKEGDDLVSWVNFLIIYNFMFLYPLLSLSKYYTFYYASVFLNLNIK